MYGPLTLPAFCGLKAANLLNLSHATWFRLGPWLFQHLVFQPNTFENPNLNLIVISLKPTGSICIQTYSLKTRFINLNDNDTSIFKLSNDKPVTTKINVFFNCVTYFLLRKLLIIKGSSIKSTDSRLYNLLQTSEDKSTLMRCKTSFITFKKPLTTNALFFHILSISSSLPRLSYLACCTVMNQ